jgi:pimeloyl-ACP methyl ester carboxylesterase
VPFAYYDWLAAARCLSRQWSRSSGGRYQGSGSPPPGTLVPFGDPPGDTGALVPGAPGTAHRVVDPRNARLLASRVDDAELTTFPGLGHLFFWEDPTAFAAAVTSFLGDEERAR